VKRYRRAALAIALAIFALAIVIYSTLPMQKGEIANAVGFALAISTTANTPLPTQKKAAFARVTAAESLHVRVRPGERAAVLGYLYNADAVTLTGLCRDGWAQIKWKNARAWVNADYLSDNQCKE
jgi:uncharacterized protein YgiM (DUF1202 family)